MVVGGGGGGGVRTKFSVQLWSQAEQKSTPTPINYSWVGSESSEWRLTKELSFSD